MQAITTTYLNPTARLGARIKATAQAGSITVHYEHRHSSMGNHFGACLALITKLGWQPAKANRYPAVWRVAELDQGRMVFVPELQDNDNSVVIPASDLKPAP